MKKKLLTLALALTMLLTLFAGCGNQPTGSTVSAAEVPTEPAVAESSPSQPAPSAVPESTQENSTTPLEDSAEPLEAPLDLREPLTYPLADGDVTFTILHSEPALGPMSGQMNMSTYGDFETIAAGTEYIGVTPEWQSLSQMSGDTQFNLIMASGDYPDVIAATDKYYVGGLTKALEDDVIIKLDDYIADGMPEYWNMVQADDTLHRAVTSDDGSYLAWYSVFDKTIVNEGYFIRKDWCDKVNMDVPTSIEEINAFAYTIQSELSLDCVLLMGEGLDTLSTAWGIGTTTASGAGFAYHREGDNLVADITSNAYRDYIAQLHQWYVDGIVSQNFSELDTSNMSGVMERELANNRTAIASTMVNSMDNLKQLNEDPDFALAAMVVTVDGGNIHTGPGERQFDSCSISTQCDPKLIPYIMGWMNYWYTEDGAMAGNYGVEGLDYEQDADGTIRYLETITENTLGYPPMLFSRARCFSGASFGLMYQDRTVPFFTEAQTDAIDTWTARTDDLNAVPKTLSLNVEESEVVALYATDLATFISEEVPKFVTGDRDLSEWDSFVTVCESMHVDELLAAYQEAYNCYSEK